MTFNLQLSLTLARRLRSLYAGEIAPNVVARSTDTQALVEKLVDGSFAVLFPGTASRRDCLTDVQIRKVDWVGGDPFATSAMRVHRGFKRALDSVYEGIEALIPPGRRVVVAGHSLGGALATLCAHALNGVAHVSDVITFGSPRVGNRQFVGEYNHTLADRTARIVNAGDPVPHVPWQFASYRHTDTQVYLTADYELRIDEPLRVAVQEFRSTIESGATIAAGMQLISEHNLNAYIRKLEGLQ